MVNHNLITDEINKKKECKEDPQLDVIKGNSLESLKTKNDAECYVITKSLVKVWKDFRENLPVGFLTYFSKDPDILRKAKETFSKGMAKGLARVASENSEDTITFAVFKILEIIPDGLWLPKLFPNINFTEGELKDVKIKFFKELEPPQERDIKEGNTEVDLIIETSNKVISVEIKYKSDLSPGTTHDETRNQLIRNIDVLSRMADKEGKNFYQVVLGVSKEKNPDLYITLENYKNNPSFISKELPYRKDINPEEISKNLIAIKWKDVKDLCNGLLKEDLPPEVRNLLKHLIIYLNRKEL